MWLDSLSLKEMRIIWPSSPSLLTFSIIKSSVPVTAVLGCVLGNQSEVCYSLMAYSSSQMFISNNQSNSSQRDTRVGTESGMLWFDCLSFPKLLLFNLTVFGGGTFKRWLGNEGSGLVVFSLEWISYCGSGFLIKVWTPFVSLTLSLPFHHEMTQQEDSHQIQVPISGDLELSSLWNCENYIPTHYPVCGILFQQCYGLHVICPLRVYVWGGWSHLKGGA